MSFTTCLNIIKHMGYTVSSTAVSDTAFLKLLLESGLLFSPSEAQLSSYRFPYSQSQDSPSFFSLGTDTLFPKSLLFLFLCWSPEKMPKNSFTFRFHYLTGYIMLSVCSTSSFHYCWAIIYNPNLLVGTFFLLYKLSGSGFVCLLDCVCLSEDLFLMPIFLKFQEPFFCSFCWIPGRSFQSGNSDPLSFIQFSLSCFFDFFSSIFSVLF